MRFAILAALTALVIPMSAKATEEPKYEVVTEDDQMQIRQYEPVILAEVEVTGSMQRAGNSGFGPLADYIFGNNTARAEIAMTAPVTRTPSQKIDMTAPVTQTRASDDTWTVSFTMPTSWSMETLPIPNNPDVTLREVPGELIAAIRFSGNGPAATQMRKQGELENWLTAQGYTATGPARYAGYDAPWKPAPFRRNEVMIPVTKIDAELTK
jgi:effector-binding domain-containing protein